MNHGQNLARLAIVVFWTIVASVVITVVSNSGNLHALGWGTLLFYGVLFVVAVYGGAVATKNYWNFK